MKVKVDKRKATIFVLVLMMLFIIVYGIFMIKHRLDYAITDAVFVDTENINNVGFQRVNGKIILMTKKEGELVKKGEVLAKIDSRTYELIVRELKAKIAAKENKR
ncbi:MAG: EmrA/EmrK family multidrug efflux transporter periplasmic adaptor subunit, partial [Deltaproteobacteria bacterium]